jgi:hypothetical protein
MTKSLFLVAAILVTGTGALTASPVVSLNPVDGAIFGSPGDTIGWGFDVQADATQWVSFAGSFTLLETNPSVGVYTDFIGMQGGPVNAVMGPGAPDWIEPFDSGSQTGIGSFAIDPSVIPGSSDSGVIRVLYVSYSIDPNFCFVECTQTPGFMDVPFTVEVAAPPPSGAPEPASLVSVLIGMSALIYRRFSKR